MRRIAILFSILCLMIVVSCNRMKAKGKQAAAVAQARIENEVRNKVDKVIPEFDAGTPDTKYNKTRFGEFLQVELTPDVKNIYCHDDRMGINSRFQFSFNCNAATASRIIARHKMTTDSSGISYTGISDEFAWWDKHEIGRLKMFVWKDRGRYFQCFWYDSIAHRAYYLDFDL